MSAVYNHDNVNAPAILGPGVPPSPEIEDDAGVNPKGGNAAPVLTANGAESKSPLSAPPSGPMKPPIIHDRQHKKKLSTVTCNHKDCAKSVKAPFKFCVAHKEYGKSNKQAHPSTMQQQLAVEVVEEKTAEAQYTPIKELNEAIKIAELNTKLRAVKRLEEQKPPAWDDVYHSVIEKRGFYYCTKDRSDENLVSTLLKEEEAVLASVGVNQIKNSFWVQPTIVQRRERFESRWYLTVNQMKYFEIHLPHVQIIAANVQQCHEHPILNITRYLASELAFQYICRHTKLSVHNKLIDVGANTSQFVRRRNTLLSAAAYHANCPILSPSDVHRRLHSGLQPGAGLCMCKAQHCACVSPTDRGALLMVHSLYYFDPETIINMIQNTNSKILVAVVHCFDDAYGSLSNGEATYMMADLSTVSMKVKGNQHTYVHSNLNWMRKSHYSSKSGLVQLVWCKLSQIGDQSLYSFTVHVGKFEDVPSVPVNISASIKDSDYYGPVSMAGAFNDSSRINVPGEVIGISDLQFYSWGSFVMAYQHTAQLSLMCPKGLVSQCSAYISGRKRSTDIFASLLNYVRYNSSKYNIPPEMIDSTSFVAACLGFVKNVALEASAMHSIIKPSLSVVSVHTEALSFKFKTVWNWKKAAAAVIAASVMGVAATALPVVGPALMSHPAPMLGLAAGFASLVHFFKKKLGPLSDPFSAYKADRSSNSSRLAVQHVPAQSLPTTSVPVTIEQVLEMPIDETAHFKPGDLTAIKAFVGPVVAGIVTTTCIPVVQDNSALSSAAAIKSRTVNPQPIHTDAFNSDFFDLYTAYTEFTFDNQFPGLRENPVVALTPFEWRSKFPLAQQRILEQAYREMETGHYSLSREALASGFPKRELLTKSDIDGVSKLAPRMIQACTPIYNHKVAPYVSAFAKRLMLVWDVSNPLGPMYTSGASAEAVGNAFAKAFEHGCSVSSIEGDFERFDSTIHDRFLRFETKIYQMSGAKDGVLQALDASTNTGGRDKWGTEYSVDGTRYSGRPATSVGNTMLQGTAIRFCIAFHHFQLHKEWLIPSELDAMYKLVLLLLGDDNLLLGQSLFVESLYHVLPALLLMLGLKLVPKLHRGPRARTHSSFCSQLFYPVEGGLTVLGPMIGRCSAKAGYYCDPPPNINMKRMIRGDALGRYRDCSYIPMLRCLWKKMIDLTSDVPQNKVWRSRDQKRYDMYAAHSLVTHSACEETWAMVHAVYGITKHDEEVYSKQLSTVTSLPCVVDNPSLAHSQAVDGVSTNHHDQHFVDQDIVESKGTTLEYDQAVKAVLEDERVTVHACITNTRPFLIDLAFSERKFRHKLASLIPPAMPDPCPKPKGVDAKAFWKLIPI
jgi:hypothetical protein